MTGERNRRVNFILMIILCCGDKTFHRFPLQHVAWFRQNYFGGWERLMRYLFRVKTSGWSLFQQHFFVC